MIKYSDKESSMNNESKPCYEDLVNRIKELEAELAGTRSITERILFLLSREWEENGPPGILDNKEIIEKLDLSVEDAEKALRKLTSEGYLSGDTMGFASYLTPEGYEKITL